LLIGGLIWNDSLTSTEVHAHPGRAVSVLDAGSFWRRRLRGCRRAGSKLIDYEAHSLAIGAARYEKWLWDSPTPAHGSLRDPKGVDRAQRAARGARYLQIRAAPRRGTASQGRLADVWLCSPGEEHSGGAAARTGIAVKTVRDIRWGAPRHKDIPCWRGSAKQAAVAEGCQELDVRRRPMVTEGASSSSFISRAGRNRTRLMTARFFLAVAESDLALANEVAFD